MKRCSNCGRAAPDDRDSCGVCGRPFRGVATERDAGAAPDPQPFVSRYDPFPAGEEGVGDAPGGVVGQVEDAATAEGPTVFHTGEPRTQATGGAPPAGHYPPPGTQITNGTAIASLVLSLVGLFMIPIIPSIAAIALGRSARTEIEASAGAQGGEGIARAGEVMGWIGVAFYGLVIVGFIALVIIGLSMS